MQKEGHTVAWQGRGIKPWATEGRLPSNRAAARATRTRGQPEENIRPRLHVANATVWPAQTQREDAIRSPQKYPRTSTTQGASDTVRTTPLEGCRGANCFE